MNFRFAWFFVFLACYVFSLSSTCLFAIPLDSQSKQKISLRSELMPIEKEANPKEWQVFHGLSESKRESVWSYHAKKGRKLKDWHWTWRIAWIRHCSQSMKPYCSKILNDGSKDEAAVVRAETANRLADRFEGTGTQYQAVITTLKNAYKLPENTRNGVPLFVRYRILAALHRIMGEQGEDAIKELASEHDLTANYYASLRKHKT